MKTIFIPVFSGIEGKNILRGGIFEALKKQGDFRIIFFVGNYARRDYYQKEYPDAEFEVIKRYRRTTLDRFFSFLKFYTLRTKTIDLKRKTNFEKRRSYPHFLASLILNRICSQTHVRRLIRFCDYLFVRDPIVEKFFIQYKSDLVFLADLFEDTEISMVREAKKRGIPSIGFLSTWDRLTSRWGIRILPDNLIVFNDVLRDEAIQYADMSERHIFVSGAVQLDLLIAKPPLPRDEFLQSMGLSADTELIVYGPLGRTFDASKQSDIEMVALLNQWIEEKKLGEGNFKLIVRFPPNDFVDQSTLTVLPHVMYDVPGVRFATVRGQDWDMKPSEIDHLRNLLSHASLVICYYSSLSIDGAVFDVPIININFDLHDAEKRHRYYETTHYSKVAALSGIKLATGADDLLSKMKEYLSDPALDRDGRKKLVEQQAYMLDGRSAERIAHFVGTHLT